MKKIKLLPYLIVILLSIPAVFALFKPGYWNMHDDMQTIRQLEMEKCLKDGQIPCRWTPDLGFSYGYPLFNFYPPMPYLVGQVFRTTGFSFIDTVKATAIVQVLLASVFMYLLASSVFGIKGGILSSLFYTYAPYHALNIYIRGAMNEAWATVFFPLIFYFSRKLILEKKNKFAVGLALSLSGLLLSHNPMVLTFTPIILIWCLFWLITTFDKKLKLKSNLINQIPNILRLFISSILGLSLSAFFTIPVLLEEKLININNMFTGYYNYSGHFVTLYQLFISNLWGNGPSIWGPNDNISFMIGYFHWIIPVLILIASVFIFIKNKKINKKILLSLILIVIGFFTIFITHEKSTFLWIIFSPIQKIQFPWRLLNPAIFLLSLSIGILPLIFKKIFEPKIIKPVIGVIIFALILININYFHPISNNSLTDSEKFSGTNWEQQISSGINDYLPITTTTTPDKVAEDFIDEINPISKYEITGGKKGTDWTFFNLFLEKDTTITISTIAFPNFEINDNNQKISYKIEPKLGRMTVDLKAGDHQIYIKLKNTPVRTISNYISLVAWIFVIGYLSLPLWNKLTLKK